MSSSTSSISSSSSSAHFLSTNDPAAHVGVAASIQIGSSMADVPKLPQEISVETLAKASASMSQYEDGRIATLEEIENCVKNKEFYPLQTLFSETVVAEYQNHSMDHELRNAFMRAFTSIRNDFNQNGIPDFYNPTEKEQLKAMVVEGKMVESVRIYSSILFDFDLKDKDYPSRIMKLSKGFLEVRGQDRLPGEAASVKEKYGLDKGLIKITGDLFDPKRVAMQKKFVKEAIPQLQRVEETLKKTYGDDLIKYLSSKYPSTIDLAQIEKEITFRKYYRGCIGSGKSELLKRDGVEEANIISNDTAKENFAREENAGGLSTHHECSAMMDEINEKTKDVKYRLIMKTNVFERDAEDIVKFNGFAVIEDIYISPKIAKNRVEERAKQGGLAATDDQILKGTIEASLHRQKIMDAAMSDPRKTYYLYDNDDSENPFIPIFSIKNGKPVIHDIKRFIKAVSPVDPKTKL